MPCSGWNEDSISVGDVAGFAVDFHGAVAFEDEVELLAELMVMALGGFADGDGGLGEALVLHGGIRAVEDAADGAAVFGCEGRLLGKRVDRHGGVGIVGNASRKASPRMKLNTQNCTAIITGASSGLGAEFARQLAPQARALVLVARRIEALEAVKSELLSINPGLEVHLVVADLSTSPGRAVLVRSRAC